MANAAVVAFLAGFWGFVLTGDRPWAFVFVASIVLFVAAFTLTILSEYTKEEP